MASNSKKLGELFGGTDDVKEAVLDNVNPSFVSDKDNTSTGYFDLPNGTTAQRPTAASGMIRFNSTLNLAEYYDGTLWKAIDSPPTVTSISPETFSASGTTITITGQNFQSGVNVKLIDTDGTELTPDSVTLVSASSVTFDTTQAMVDNEKDKFDVRVTNPSGLSGTLDNVLEISDGTFSFTSSATSTLYDSGRSSGFDAGGSLSGGGGESDISISYAVTAGSLPSGGSINSSTGNVTGISAVGSDTVSNFTVTATVADASEGTSDTYTRAFALTVKSPTVTSYTSTGSGTFSVPTGTTTVDVLVVAGGGGAAGEAGGGGGAGGLIYRPAFPVTPQGSISYSVGAGGAEGQYNGMSDAPDRRGQDSTFGSLTAKGGGRASTSSQDSGDPLIQGGSGGGRHGNGPSLGRAAGIQPQQPGDSGTYGFGNSGGDNNGSLNPGGGGGGAGAGGADNSQIGQGGAGKQYDISGSQTYYAGGGGGGARGGTAGQGGQGGGGQGGGNPNGTGNTRGDDGVVNRGGGGGGGTGGGSPLGGGGNGGAGGSGIVIVKY